MTHSPNFSAIHPLNIEKARVLVVGDVMLDRYWQGSTDRISPEAPVPVVKISDRSMRVGGAGNVAVNITSLGGQASLIGMVGEDEAAQDLAKLLEDSQVADHCVSDSSISTTIKLRVLAQHQQLIRLDFEADVSHLNQQKIIDRFERLLADVNLVILSDYGKGVMHDTSGFIAKANAKGVKVLVDPKKVDFSEYAGAYLVTPNKKEFEAVVGHCRNEAELEEKARHLIKVHHLGGLLVTQGADGMTLIMDGEKSLHFSTHAQEVYDVTGAGDTVIAALAAGISSGLEVAKAVHLSCVAAGIVVGRIGTASVNQDDLNDAFAIKTMSKQKICDEAMLLSLVDKAKQQGQKVIFTNGCFDILHAGHVQYLEKAAELGELFIVAVNSDESVQRLKGATRPINALEHRMAVLSALASVDYVVAFSEDTPERLICQLRPDVLVKGGDYKISEIAGRDCVDDVVLIDVLEGHSTSNLVRKIKS